MAWQIAEQMPFDSQREQILKKTTFDPEQQLVLADFATLLAFVHDRQPGVSKTGQLPLTVLNDINTRLKRGVSLNLKRPLQKSFPHINGLYLLLRASGLTFIGGSGKKLQMLVDEPLYEAWQQLNPVEQYGNLLETWLLRGYPDIIGERVGGFMSTPNHSSNIALFFMSLPSEGIYPAQDKASEEDLRYIPGLYNLALMELFGFIQISDAPPLPGGGWRIEQIQQTPFGQAILSFLWHKFFVTSRFWRVKFGEPAEPGIFQPLFQPYFPDWQRNMRLPTWEFRPGVYCFKVSLGSIWRRIALPADASLEDLAWAILSSVNFDDDHLYQFSYQNRFGTIERVNHSYMDEGPYTGERRIGDLPLRIGQAMVFLFDFGDNWEFGVTLEEVDETKTLAQPVVLESKGVAPPQYRSWGEDESDW